MSQLFVDNIKNKLDGAIEAPSGIVVTGVITATSFVGSGASLTGIDATALKDSGGNIKVQANTSGIVVTGVSTFSGNVSVGKTLTYEDVTNVDSVGVITARSGIKIGVGQSISAVSGIITYYGDGSQLTGVESGVGNFVASGTIPNGATVIIKADGTVTGVATAGAGTTFTSPPTVLTSDVMTDVRGTYDTANDKVVFVYVSSTGLDSDAKVGTVSGTSISFGTNVQAINTNVSYHDICYDSNTGKVVYVYRGEDNTGYAKVGTVSGTSISFGSEVQFTSETCDWPRITYDENAQKVVIVYSTNTSSYVGKSIVGTVSGTSISFGSEATFDSGRVYGKDIVYDVASQKVVIVYKDNSDSNKGKGIVGTVSGTSISFGSETLFESGAINSTDIAVSYDSANEKVVVVYVDESSGDHGTAIVGTVSGTSISFAGPQVFSSASTSQVAVEYHPISAKTIIVYRGANSGLREASISGDTISFGDEVLVFSGNTSEEYPGMVYDPDQNAMVIGFRWDNNSGSGATVVYKPSAIVTNLTAENYIGIAAEAISNGATGKVNILGGVNTGQTGLTTAQTYYVQNDGTLDTSAGDPSVVAGTAISNTKILVR
jgi:hypothetical protein